MGYEWTNLLDATMAAQEQVRDIPLAGECDMAGANSIDVQSLASTLFQVYLGLYLGTTLNTTDGDNLVQGITYFHVGELFICPGFWCSRLL